MAEIVGVIAASLEITKAIAQAKGKLHALREASTTINALFQETDRLSKLLAFILRQQQTLFPSGQPADEQNEIYTECTSAANDLLKCIGQLKNLIEQSRWQGSMKLLLKTSKIKTYQEVLERAKLSLLLAQSTQSILLHHQQIVQQADTQTLLRVLAVNNTHEQATGSATGQATLTQVDVTGPRKFQRKGVPSARKGHAAFIPLRLLGWTLSIKAARHFDAWTFNLRIRNHVPRDSIIFSLAANGDVEAVRGMLENGKAGVNDIGGALTVLHHAAANRQTDVVRLLIEYGADVNSCGQYLKNGVGIGTPCDYFLLSQPFGPSDTTQNICSANSVWLEDQINPIMALLTDNGIDTFVDDIDSLLTAATLMHTQSFGLPQGPIPLAILATSLMKFTWPPYKELPLARRTCFASFAVLDWGPPDVDLFLALLAQDFDESCLRIFNEQSIECRHYLRRVEDHQPILAIVSGGIAASIPHHFIQPVHQQMFALRFGRPTIRRQGWSDLLKKVLELGGTADFGKQSALLRFLYNLLSQLFVNETINDALLQHSINIWIDELRKAGMSAADLDRYRHHEKKLLTEDETTFYVNDEEDKVTFNISDIQVDEDTTTWRLIYTWSFEKALTMEQLVDKLPGAFTES